jgi:1-acyl-sn-glycerol-3-phosphate acyltransferase
MKKKKSFLFYRFSRKMVEYFFRIFYRLKIYGEKEHFFKGRAIIAGNHVSYFDPPAVGVGWQEVTHYFAKPSLFEKPLLGFLLRSYNVHPLPADSPSNAIKSICALLNQELKVVIFPEGTRAKEDRILNPKQGFSMIAHRTDSPIIPVYIGGAFDIWNRTLKWPKLKGRLVCVFGLPLKWQDFSDLSKKEAQEAMVIKWQKAVEGLKNWYEKGAKGSPP